MRWKETDAPASMEVPYTVHEQTNRRTEVLRDVTVVGFVFTLTNRAESSFATSKDSTGPVGCEVPFATHPQVPTGPECK